MERDTTISEIVTAAIRAMRNDTFHVQPGAVISYDDTQETATVQQMTNDVRFNLDTGARVSEPGTILTGVPVLFFRGGGMVIKWTLNKYDPGILVAFDLDPTSWRQQGRSLSPVDPADVRRHGGGYWFFIPCDVTLSKSPSAPGKLTIGEEGQDPIIIISGGTIQLGSSSADASALASKVDNLFGLLATLAAKLALVTVNVGTGDVSGTNWAAVVTAAGAVPSVPSSVASTLVKVEK